VPDPKPSKLNSLDGNNARKGQIRAIADKRPTISELDTQLHKTEMIIV
jgi:hypothetical protein